MKATLEYIRAKFDEFNLLCFEGKLQPLPFKLSNARTFLGKVSFFRMRNLDGSWRYHGFVFRISSKIDLPEEVIEDTIIHEMIHYWILSNQWQDSSAHGHLFRAKMLEINAKHHRHVTVTHKVTKEDHDRDTEKRQHLICVTRLRNGKQGITIAARTRLFRLWDEMARLPDVVEQRWVTTTDPFFNRIPRSLTPKIYLIAPDELALHLQDARELIRRGHTILVKR